MKKLILLLLGLSTFVFSNQVTHAQENISMPSVEINGVKEFLYKEFTDQDKALTDVVTKYKTHFDTIKQKYKLKEPISTKNWEKYREKFIQEYGVMTSDNSIDAIFKFFGTFEGKYKNKQIKEKLLINDYSELEYLLPYYSTYVTKKLGQPRNLDTANKELLKKQKELKISTRATELPRINSAIHYAVLYGERPNYSKYAYFGHGDCANFVSQILEAGGLPQTNSGNRETGWWHSIENGKHNHSLSWTVADRFVRHMGVTFLTRNHHTFSTKVVAGDMIGLDFDGNGAWDHVAFVVQDENFEANYHGKYYFDYKVAQHTPNYVGWVSETYNNWEHGEDRGYTYAIIRGS